MGRAPDPAGPPQDADYDMVPDWLEPALGYVVGLSDTDGDGYVDGEDHAIDFHPHWWVEGSADHEDWAFPGKQSQS